MLNKSKPKKANKIKTLTQKTVKHISKQMAWKKQLDKNGFEYVRFHMVFGPRKASGDLPANRGGFIISYSIKDYGKGNVVIRVLPEGVYECDSGKMPKEFVQALLNNMVDKLKIF